jgi:hypothetical protein
MKTIIIGKLTEVGSVDVKDNYSAQRITVLVQEFDQTSGDKRDPQVFQGTIFNKKIKELQATDLVGKRVKMTSYLKSLMSSKDGKYFYNIALNVNDLTELDD